MQQHGMARGVDTAFAGQRFNRVTRYQPNQEKRQQSHTEKVGTSKCSRLIAKRHIGFQCSTLCPG